MAQKHPFLILWGYLFANLILITVELTRRNGAASVSYHCTKYSYYEVRRCYPYSSCKEIPRVDQWSILYGCATHPMILPSSVMRPVFTLGNMTLTAHLHTFFPHTSSLPSSLPTYKNRTRFTTLFLQHPLPGPYSQESLADS